MKFGSHVSDSTSVKNRLINDYVRVGLLSENKMSIRISRQELASSLRIEDVRVTWKRYLFLCLCCMVALSSSFGVNNPSSLQVQIMTDQQLTHTQYNFINIVYSGASIPGVLIAGLILDRYRPPLTNSIFITI